MKNTVTSLIMPGIRVSHWEETYNSICESTKRPFELIIVSPYDLPKELEDKKNIKILKDWGNIVRCHNLGLSLAVGTYVTNVADDGVLAKDALDVVIDQFEALPPNPKNIINAAYTEGGNAHDESYNIINNAPETRSPYIGDKWYILQQGLLYTKYFIELGGLDYRFEVQPMALIDLAVRAYRDGALVYFSDTIVQHATHMPGRTGDHAPVNDAQLGNDIPLFQRLHRDPKHISRIKLDVNEWLLSPPIWERRFANQ